MSLPPTGRRLPPLLPSEKENQSPRRGRQKRRQNSPEQSAGTGTARERRRQRSASRERDQSVENLPKLKTKTPAKRALPPRRSGEDTPSGSGGRGRQKSKSVVSEDVDSATVGSATQLETTASQARPKRRRKKKKPVSESQDNLTGSIVDDDELNSIMGMDVTTIKNDIIDVKTQPDHSQVEDEDDEGVPPVPTHTLGPVMKSQASDRLYIEQRKGFKSKNKTVLAKQMAANEREKWTAEQKEETTNSLELSVSSHRAFKTFSLFCHGLLAGLSVAQTVVVFLLSSFSDTDFILHYRPLALPYEAVYHFLCVVCTVSVFDRYDIAYPNKRFFLRCVTFQSGAIVVVIYFLCLMVNNSIQVWDDRLGDHRNTTLDTDLWSDSGTTTTILSQWRALNAVRAAGALLGWFIISLRPATDRLTKNLQQSDENFIGDEVPGIQELVAKCHPPGVYKTKTTVNDPYAHISV